MSEVARRERLRATTEVEIRHHARALLISQGRDAVTLRAIARELGITAPALYRYYNSREDLLRQLCNDICTDLSGELTANLESVPADDPLGKVLTVCRSFRRWALAHPQEFTLVFATPSTETNGHVHPARQPEHPDQFASVFLSIVGSLITDGGFKPRTDRMPLGLQDELAGNQRALASAFSVEGIDIPPEALGPDGVYLLLTWWIRIYGHIALEVFGRFPFAVDQADRLFDSMLGELARDLGWDV